MRYTFVNGEEIDPAARRRKTSSDCPKSMPDRKMTLADCPMAKRDREHATLLGIPLPAVFE